MGTISLVVVASLAIAASDVAAAPDVPDHATTSGLALAIGMGYQTPAFGGQVNYYWMPPGWPVGFMGRLGLGWWPAPREEGGETGEDQAGLAGGGSIFVGHRHRLVLDGDYGLAGVETLRLGGALLEQHNLYGATAALGYEYAGRWGFLFRASGGATYLVTDPSSETSRFTPTLNLAIGVKLY